MAGGGESTWGLRGVRLGLVGLALVAVAFVITTQCGVREVRIDSGDRRIRWLFFSIPESPVPGREDLIRLSKELKIPAEWHRPPFTAPTNTDQGRFKQFSGAAWWAKHEPPLGAIILKQLASYYMHPPSESGLPRATHFNFLLEWDRDQKDYAVSSFWLESYTPESLQYLIDEIGYQPASGSVVDGMMRECRGRGEGERAKMGLPQEGR